MAGSRPGSEVLGPVQILVIDVEDATAKRRIGDELRRLTGAAGVRVLDAMSVRRLASGDVVRGPSLGWTASEGHLVEALLSAEATGATAEPERPAREEVWYLADRIPPLRLAAIILIEHQWAIPVREAALEFDAENFGDAWVHPRDLASARHAAEAGSA